jgi:hypothetical protein
MLGSRAEQLSVTRVASTATVNGTTYNFPANIVRVGNPGVGQPAGAYDTGVGVTSPALPLASWCASGTWQPDAAAWNAVDATLWGVGTAAAANSARLRSLAAGQISCEVYDASAVARTAAWTHAYGSGSAHALACCNLNGAVSLYSDGSQVASTSTGGAGIWTVAPTAATWGAPSTAGWVRAPRECHSGSLGACR